MPVTIQGTWQSWTPHQMLFYPGHVEVTIHDPIPVAGLTVSDIGSVRDRAHEAVAATYRSPAAPAEN